MKSPQNYFQVEGITVLKPNHPSVKKLSLKRHLPNSFGSRIWLSSYLLMDYICSSLTATPDQHFLELGCGWGLPATYIKKKFQAQVTASDSDEHVFAYQQLLSNINNVEVTAKHCSFAELTEEDLSDIDIMVGADICYSPPMARQLEQLVNNFAECGGKKFVLADSGRQPFTALVDQLSGRYNLTHREVSIKRPTIVAGYILDATLNL